MGTQASHHRRSVSLLPELWILIFSMVPKVDSHNDLLGENAKIWLSYRTVSKQWNQCICQSDFSQIQSNLFDAHLNIQKILSMFPSFSNLDLTRCSGDHLYSVDLLTNLKRLSLEKRHCLLDLEQQVSRLTRLTGLTVVNWALPIFRIIELTGLQELTARSRRHGWHLLTRLNALTNLRSLYFSDDSRKLTFCLSGLTNLNSLCIEVEDECQFEMDDISTLTKLQFLYLPSVVNIYQFTTLTNLKNLPPPPPTQKNKNNWLDLVFTSAFGDD